MSDHAYAVPLIAAQSWLVCPLQDTESFSEERATHSLTVIGFIFDHSRLQNSGAAGDRTPGLDSAIVALSQLSYCPHLTDPHR